MSRDRDLSRRTVLRAFGATAGTGALAGRAVAGGGRGRGGNAGRGRGSAAKAAGGGVMIDLESCQVATVRGSKNKVENVVARSEFYHEFEGDLQRSYATRSYGPPPVTVDVSDGVGGAPEAVAEYALVWIEAVDEDYQTIARVYAPDEWDCESLIR